jgi:hypothetical protein
LQGRRRSLQFLTDPKMANDLILSRWRETTRAQTLVRRILVLERSPAAPAQQPKTPVTATFGNLFSGVQSLNVGKAMWPLRPASDRSSFEKNDWPS